MNHPISLVVALVTAGSVFVIGCSGGDDGGGKTGGTSSTDKSPTSPAPSGSNTGGSGASGSGASNGSSGDGSGSTTSLHGCVKPGDKGNEKGIGAYCEKTADCGSGLLCTKDFGATDSEPWFCTTPCTDDAACGTGAVCYAEARGKGCLPTVCKP